ncbi:hypothetical protein A4D02_09340 [Niastella koreensis]|uniref:Thioredoxin domain-containing protein n=3 Tax=Niastella koreensis TaxID=354356 RepID=G8TLY1_NIAKG|nr:Thioredoxin domain-containing protein [Niastella koreensis GR20-10]OQP44977.1 hypothetical protein A4D02_09340 [Niastella koreensis]
MRKICWLYLLIIPIILHAQQVDSIRVNFESDLDWQQVLEKAKIENKHIFVDCYTTWCAPCRKMEAEVYSTDQVANYLNNNFISVKFQMDKTDKDNNNIKSHYKDVEYLSKQYTITGYPTFLFFSSDGKLVHQDLGYKSVPDFLILTKNASDPKRQYYTQVEEYKAGKKNYADMVELAIASRQNGNYEIAKKIAHDYKKNVIDTLSDNALLTRMNLVLFDNFYTLFFEEGTNGRLFKLFLNRGAEVDRIINKPDFSDFFISKMIEKEEIDDKIYKDGQPVKEEPRWKDMSRSITKKYGEKYAVSLVPMAKVQFYKRTKKWSEFAKLFESRIKEFPPRENSTVFSKSVGHPSANLGDAWVLNDFCWDLFRLCDDKNVLKKALVWTDIAIKLEFDPSLYLTFYDTKANLLYKMGRVNEAVQLEEKTIAIAIKRNLLAEFLIDEFKKSLDKMRKGEPTWRS